MSNDRQNPKQGETGATAPRLAAAMESVRAVTDGHGPGSERAQLGRMGGGRRTVETGEQHEPGAENTGQA